MWQDIVQNVTEGRLLGKICGEGHKRQWLMVDAFLAAMGYFFGVAIDTKGNG